MGGTRRLPPDPPSSPSSSLSTGRLFPPPPSSPPTCSSLRGQGSPPPLGRRAGGSGINPPPTRTFPLPLPRRPRARAGWTLRPGVLGGGVPAAPCPSTPSESGPGRGRGRGKGAGRRCSNLFPSPGGGRCSGSTVRVCAPTGPPTPPPPARRVGAALKGLGARLRRLGIRAEEGGWGRGAECCRVSHVRPTYSPAPTGSRAAGPWGQQEPPLAGGGGLGAQTTPPRLPSLLRAFVWWDRLGRSPNPVLGPGGEWVPRLGEETGAWDGLSIAPSVSGSI